MKKDIILLALSLLIFVSLSGCRRRTEAIGPVGFPNYRVKSLSQRLNQENNHPSTVPIKYAVLINGDGDNRFTADITVSYEILLENGFRAENIYILNYSALETYYHPVDDVLTKSNLKLLFSYLKNKTTNRDLLFVYVTDHGERVKKISLYPLRFVDLSTIDLVDEQIDQVEFANLFDGMNINLGIFVFNQCFSGGFAEELGRNNFIAVASTKASKGGYDDVGDSFCGFFMLAFRDWRVSDTNKDGKVSISEAVEYAKQRNSYSRNKQQEPFIQSDLDPKKVFLNLPTF